MRRSHFYFTFILALLLSVACTFQFQAHAAPPGFSLVHSFDMFYLEGFGYFSLIFSSFVI